MSEARIPISDQRIDAILNKEACVLIVDDAPQNIDVLKGILGSDYKIKIAINGHQALKICDKATPDLILLDIMMPGMSGHSVCMKLKENPDTQHVPVMFVTAMEEDEDEVKGFALGAVDYITKPVSPPIVKARVKTHLMLKKQADVLEYLSNIDRLTNIYNRRRFDEVLQREWHRGIRHKTPVSLVFSDVDFFKKYNDHYGHVEGDQCLIAVAGALDASAPRKTDFVARYGGEEFIIVLPDTPLEAAAILAEKVCKNVGALNIPHAQSAAADHVTLSLGVACMQPDPSTSPAALVKAADDALYQSKEKGRNQVQCYQQEGA